MAISVLIMIAAVLGMILAQDLFLKIVAIAVFVIAAISFFAREVRLFGKIKRLEHLIGLLSIPEQDQKENESDRN